MKFLSVIVLSLAGTALAKGNNKAKNGTSTGATSTKAQCRQVAKLTELTTLAANQTLLDKVTKNNATRAAAIQAKASAAATQLSTLESNSTLMTACDQIFAVDAMEMACGKMARLEKLQEVVANQTELDKVTKNNATRADALKAKASADASELATMQSNTTLTAFCSVQQTMEDCKSMVKLQKEVAMAANTTELDAKFKGNQTKIADFQAKAAKAQTKLTAMTSNSTLTSMCASLKSATGASTADAAASSASSSTSANAAKSGAAGSAVQQGAALAAVLFAGCLLLL
ncbi:hypothetical protein QBC46DRAFT_3109 [Diplogelasinospora grovesii]|uniref:Cell wall protein n=1 Tax=Diplogelasinospora grovesii TaxID=303347 RepID=A0AAN6SA99_9PEZI|nr:hypothetical protein QBC46DRAFT_3109 [Diplogelasinospora grovesii]